MAYAWLQDLPITREVYQQIRAALGSETPPGLLVHLVTNNPDGSGLRYTDVWESKEACERFLEERVHPVLGRVFAAAGRPAPAEPVRTELEIVELFGALVQSKG